MEVNLKELLLVGIFLFTSIFVWAQQPTDQDCLGAITVCQSVYKQSNSYTGTGNYPNRIPTTVNCHGNCLSYGEKNNIK